MEDQGQEAVKTFITVEVAYALPERQWLVKVQLPAGATVQAAIDASGIADQVPGIEITPDRLGVFSIKAEPTTTLHDGDRVEIYRPLQVDPKESRRRRAKEGSAD